MAPAKLKVAGQKGFEMLMWIGAPLQLLPRFCYPASHPTVYPTPPPRLTMYPQPHTPHLQPRVLSDSFSRVLQALQADTTDSTFDTLHYTTIHNNTLHYTTLRYTALHFTTLHNTTLKVQGQSQPSETSSIQMGDSLPRHHTR